MSSLIALLAISCLAQEGPAILAPVHESVVTPGVLRVIARAEGAAKLLLDGKPVAAATPASGIWMAEIKASEGLHELTIQSGHGNSATVKFFGGKEHNQWGTFQTHPPGNVSCDTCHAVKNGVWTMKRATLAPLCHTCHNREKFVPSHTHNTDTLADCQNCHLPHGSTAPRHLKQAKDVVCKQCHN